MYAGLQVRCQQNLAGARPGELLLCILEEDPFLGLEIAASASGVLGSAGPLASRAKASSVALYPVQRFLQLKALLLAHNGTA